MTKRTATGIATALALLGAGAAQAVGFGGWLDYSYADGKLDYENDFSSSDEDFTKDRVGFGFALDTNVAANRLFNYRFQLGYQHGWRDGGPPFNRNLEFNSFMMSHTFGFGVVRTPNARFWLGPTLRIGVDGYEDESFPIDEAVDVSGGFGPTLGVNMHVSPVVSVGLSVGYQYMWLGEVIDFDGGGNDEGYGGREHLVTTGITILFRTGSDNWRRKAKVQVGR